MALDTRLSPELSRLDRAINWADCPELTAAYVRDAAGYLGDHDLVLGPAEDGGYGLIALGRPAPKLFADEPWGSSAVLRDTLARADDAGLSVKLMGTIWDVDDGADWARYQAVILGGKPG